MSFRPAWFGPNTEYQSLSSFQEFQEGDPSPNPNDKRPDWRQFSTSSNITRQSVSAPASVRSWPTNIFFQSFAFFWLVPIVALLYLNLHGHIIGATAWCPTGRCSVDPLSESTSVTESNILRFDQNDHNLLGTLQLVAKALEIWFVIIAVSLTYLLTMKLAGSSEGLPLGYLTRSLEMPELVSLIDILLWTTWRAPRGRTQSFKRKTILLAFLIFSALLCILCNLMGPAVAVLVIPTLQWIETPMFGQHSFDHFVSKDPPSPGGWAFYDAGYCTDADFKNKRWSCTQYIWGSSLDAWTNSWISSTAEAYEGSALTTVQQGYLSFSFNSSTTYAQNTVNQTDLTAIWIPSRQTISNFSADYDNIWEIANSQANSTSLALTQADFNSYAAWNDSLRMQIRRSGPVMGTLMNYWTISNGSWWNSRIDVHRSVQCYPKWGFASAAGYPGQPGNSYTRCIQIGTGWNEYTKDEDFYIDGSYRTETQKVGVPTHVHVYSSGNVAFFRDGKFPESIDPRCYQNGTIPTGVSCDWDAFFAPDPSLPDLLNQTRLANTIHVWMADQPGGKLGYQWVVDYVAFYNFTTYSLDPSSLSNYMRIVEIDSVPESGTAIPVDPNWTLAAWSVTPGTTLAANRSTSLMLSDVMETLTGYRNATQLPFGSTTAFTASLYLPVLQTLSLIEYVEHPTSDSTSEDPLRPLLQLNAQIYVWAYGLSSRTAIMGTVVAIIGCVVVVAKVILGLMDRRKFRNVTQLLVSALEHVPRAEFDDVQEDEAQQARMRFEVVEVDDNAGKLKYRSLMSRVRVGV